MMNKLLQATVNLAALCAAALPSFASSAILITVDFSYTFTEKGILQTIPAGYMVTPNMMICVSRPSCEMFLPATTVPITGTNSFTFDLDKHNEPVSVNYSDFSHWAGMNVASITFSGDMTWSAPFLTSYPSEMTTGAVDAAILGKPSSMRDSQMRLATSSSLFMDEEGNQEYYNIGLNAGTRLPTAYGVEQPNVPGQQFLIDGEYFTPDSLLAYYSYMIENHAPLDYEESYSIARGGEDCYRIPDYWGNPNICQFAPPTYVEGMLYRGVAYITGFTIYEANDGQVPLPATLALLSIGAFIPLLTKHGKQSK